MGQGVNATSNSDQNELLCGGKFKEARVEGGETVACLVLMVIPDQRRSI